MKNLQFWGPEYTSDSAWDQGMCGGFQEEIRLEQTAKDGGLVSTSLDKISWSI